MTKEYQFAADGARIDMQEVDKDRPWENRRLLDLPLMRETSLSPAAYPFEKMCETAELLARCLNAATSLAPGDLKKAAERLEVLAKDKGQAQATVSPETSMREAMKYVFKQEGWKFGVRPQVMSDGVRLHVNNPDGIEIPLAVHVSTRGKSPSYWVMEESRVIQGTHAYKIPIQAAVALQQAVNDYLTYRDAGSNLGVQYYR